MLWGVGAPKRWPEIWTRVGPFPRRKFCWFSLAVATAAEGSTFVGRGGERESGLAEEMFATFVDAGMDAVVAAVGGGGDASFGIVEDDCIPAVRRA